MPPQLLIAEKSASELRGACSVVTNLQSCQGAQP